MQPFHLAFPVTDMAETERFYVEVLGCEIGRRTSSSINFNFGGHQIVAHEVIQMPDMSDGSGVDGKKVPPFHFGMVLEWDEWHYFRDRLQAMNVNFRIKPHVRYPGKIGEQSTLFIDDPSGNALEFKSFKDASKLFATRKGHESEDGGGLMSQGVFPMDDDSTNP